MCDSCLSERDFIAYKVCPLAINFELFYFIRIAAFVVAVAVAVIVAD